MKESDWGFPQFCALGDLTKPGSGYLEGDLLEIERRIDLRNRRAVRASPGGSVPSQTVPHGPLQAQRPTG